MARIRNIRHTFRSTPEENKNLLKLVKESNTDITNLVNKLIKEELERLGGNK